MKYIFLILLGWLIGFSLPFFAPTFQLLASLLCLGIVVLSVYYYIDTRINAVRP